MNCIFLSEIVPIWYCWKSNHEASFTACQIIRNLRQKSGHCL